MLLSLTSHNLNCENNTEILKFSKYKYLNRQFYYTTVYAFAKTHALLQILTSHSPFQHHPVTNTFILKQLKRQTND